jgi:hypothetical protein
VAEFEPWRLSALVQMLTSHLEEIGEGGGIKTNARERGRASPNEKAIR